MEVALQVVELANGNFAVRSIGGSALSVTLAEFADQTEAEEWMLRRSLSSSDTMSIMRPGDGQALG